MPISFCSSGAPIYGVFKEERTFPPPQNHMRRERYFCFRVRVCRILIVWRGRRTPTRTSIRKRPPHFLELSRRFLRSFLLRIQQSFSPGRLLLWTLTDLTENNLVATNPSNRFDEGRRRSRRRLDVLSDYNESVDATADAFVIAAGGAALEAALPGTVRIVSEG